jgi:hypothetical protein
MPEPARAPETVADAAPLPEPAPHTPERGGRVERKEPQERQERAPRVESGEQIGITGERLSRDEEFDLVRRSDYRTIEVNRGQIVFDSADAAANAERAAEGA